MYVISLAHVSKYFTWWEFPASEFLDSDFLRKAWEFFVKLQQKILWNWNSDSVAFSSPKNKVQFQTFGGIYKYIHVSFKSQLVEYIRRSKLLSK